MKDFFACFAGCCVQIRSDCPAGHDFLKLLFGDLERQDGDVCGEILVLARCGDSDYQLLENKQLIYRGVLGPRMAAPLYDRVIFHLLNRNNQGIALHTGAVSRDGKTIFVPGRSGAGKSSLITWLVGNGFSYQTDELVFLPFDDMECGEPFVRPISLKQGSLEAVSACFKAVREGWVEDAFGAIVPFRLLNEQLVKEAGAVAAIIFPSFEAGVQLRVEPVSKARAVNELLSCCANARNLEGHGFRELASFVKKRPVYQLSYGSFSQLGGALDDILSAANDN